MKVKNNMLRELVLYTSGSTAEPKIVIHNSHTVQQMLTRSITELQLTSNDAVLNIFPSNVIAYYSITGLPAISIGAKLINLKFDPYEYIRCFNEHRPTVTAIIPIHWEILNKTKEFQNLDMSCVRYCVVGSKSISVEMIEDLKKKGIKTVGNWYGSTEDPPPVFVGYNSNQFDFTPKLNYSVSFASDGECIINDRLTSDVFDLQTKTFLKRKNIANGKTWKTTI